MHKQKKLNRRDFLKNTAGSTAAALLGFPYIISSSALGNENRPAPSDRIVMGCIGLGGQGTFNLRAFLNQPDVQVVALCDVNEGSDDYDMLYQFKGTTAGLKPALERVETFYAEQTTSGSYKGCDTYHDFRDLLARKDIDAVTVCTPDHWHGLISIAAAKAGKDIYCEKPLTNTIVEGRAVSDAVKRYERILQTGSHERSNHSVRYAAELIQNGRIGKLHTIRVNMPIDNDVAIPPQPIMPVPPGLDYDFWLGPTPWASYTKKRSHFWWRYILSYGGGEMTDRGAHILDLAQLVMGTDETGPVEFSGIGEAPRDGLFNTFINYNYQCRYANGVQLIGKYDLPRGIKFEGTDGWIFIHIHGGRLESEPKSIVQEIIEPDEIHVGRSPGHQRNFLDCVITRNKPMADAETGHRTATICHLLNIAMLTEQKLLWDPKLEQITNSPEANKMIAPPMRSPWRLS
ncbi:Gfo/Idh/MocA family oxidoreductase [candidate division KSB1 bacterium]|nr:Gfo/Idh/MocA family oxidoreductase [candidate division KSB1 bacterium]